jgi:hypothetical protein
MGHCCEPDRYPANLDETWKCPECNRGYVAFCVTHGSTTEDRHFSPTVELLVPAGTLGWTTATP